MDNELDFSLPEDIVSKEFNTQLRKSLEFSLVLQNIGRLIPEPRVEETFRFEMQPRVERPYLTKEEILANFRERFKEDTP